MERFEINVPDTVLADLRDRLGRTRFPDNLANENWDYGTDTHYLKQLCDYWREDFDWRAQEREINSFPHHKVAIDGNPIHFIWERGKGPRPMPLILNHGWPWTFWDMRKIIGPLADPAAYGGDPADAFDVIVPSLPGYGFSSPLKQTGINFWRTADLWVNLMQDVLGYDTFASYGGDWGALVTAQLGHKYADKLTGIYVSLPLPLDLFFAPLPGPEDFAPDEAGWHARNERFFASGSGYSAIQATKPQTLAFGLNDSPAAQCAWILEKRRDWSDCGGDVEQVFSRDDLLTTMTLYWATQTGGSSARFYYECVASPWKASHDRHPVIEAPTGVAAFEKEVLLMPKAWIERYYNLQRYRRFPSGGHFAPVERPETLVGELRDFFRPLRQA